MIVRARIVDPQYLVETDCLAAHLADPDLRVFDCTTYLDPDPVHVYAVPSSWPEWEKDHIAGRRRAGRQVANTGGPLPDLLSLSGERRGKEAERCAGDERSPIYHSIT